ncbi:type II toxin-antitoxin system death-on-curing family toxin [Saccharolobus caldissimus]|uniref:Death-on-curing protein n=1 Tax=Saccharolobus caldissimus TaxID=1702097 RepID=A0AAQ4CWT6_9CREN|nr:type II toxin-antitoxin system death-on-curing family toxin [Saccharolobus caldissimus]BDC00268.1 death-on-curing protein [Saccharolobus caldissimus]
MLEEKLLKILEVLLKEFEAWIRGKSEEKPLIIEIHDKLIANNTYSEGGVINLDDIGIAIYSAIEDLMRNHDVSRSLAVLTYHLVISHPFVDGNKRTTLGFLLEILHDLFEDKIEIPQDLVDRLMQTLVEIADNPPEEDEVAISRIRSIIRDLIPVNQD